VPPLGKREKIKADEGEIVKSTQWGVVIQAWGASHNKWGGEKQQQERIRARRGQGETLLI